MSNTPVDATASEFHTPLPRYFPALDGVRGLAVLIVVMHNLSPLSDPHGIMAHLMASSLDRGWVGVQLFFALSGFLITGILLDTRKATNYYSSFFGRRVLRIFPLYYATLAMMFFVLPALNIWHGHSVSEHPHQLWALLFMSNWVQPFHVGEGSLPHFWSLAVEEQFYLVWPFLVRSRNAGQVFKLCIVVAVIALVTRYVMLRLGFPQEAVYEFSVCRMGSLAVGAAAAALLRMPQWLDLLMGYRKQLFWVCAGLLLGGAAISHGYLQTGESTQLFGYSFLSAGFGTFVLLVAFADMNGTKGWPSLLRNPVLGRFGLYSYGMYVLHVPLREIIFVPLLHRWGLDIDANAKMTLVYLLIGTLITFIAAAASYHLFEVHFLRLKRYFTSSARTETSPAVPAVAAPVSASGNQ